MSQGQAKKIIPSKYQEALYSWVKNPKPKSRVAVVEAVAGSGKTTTSIQAVQHIPENQSVIYIAFNRDIVTSVSDKLPAGRDRPVTCRTFNSIGHRTWCKHTGNFKINIDGHLNYKFIGECMDSDGILSKEVRATLSDAMSKRVAPEHLKRYNKILSQSMSRDRQDMARLVGLCKASGVIPQHVQDQGFFGVYPDRYENIVQIIDAAGIVFVLNDAAVYIAQHCLRRTFEESEETIDYDSQIYLPVVVGARFEKYDWVLADEVQDTSPMQQYILEHLMHDKSRLIAVGDSRQAIYAWRGAGCQSMNDLKTKFNAESFPLSICYRCPKKIVEHAKEIVPHIEWFEGQIDGTIEYLDTFDVRLFTSQDIVLCRNWSPLMELAQKLIAQKIPFRMLGKEQNSLSRLVAKMDAASLEELEHKFGEYLAREKKRLTKNSQEYKFGDIEDRVESILKFIPKLKESERTVNGLINLINYIFDAGELEKRPAVTLSTCHRSKGGEWDHVFLLDAHRMPSPYAKTEEALMQERNLEYVARSRAKKTLTYITSEGIS